MHSVSHHSVLVCFPHRSLCARSISPCWLFSLGDSPRRVDPCAPRAHLTLMVTPRTHCHFTVQARALRVPELCDDHTPPSCFVTHSFAEPRCRSVNTLVLPDPFIAHTGSPGDIPSVCIALAFRQVVRLGASWSVLFICLCLYTPQLLAASALLCPFSLSLPAQMDQLQNMRLPPGTTGWNHSYFTGIPLPAPHSLQQLQAGASSPSPVQISASTREPHGAATSSSVSCPQVTHGAISPQVQTGPTRTVTSDFPAAYATHPHTTSGCRHADYSTHRCLPGRFYATLVQGVLGSTFYARCSRPSPLVTS